MLRPEGGAGSGVYSQVRVCGGGNQGSAPQPPPQDKAILHQGTHLQTQLAHSHFSAPHARQQNVPPPAGSIYHHVQSQMRAAQSRNHPPIPQARMIVPFYSDSGINPPPLYPMYPSLPLYPVNSIPPPSQAESGNAQRGAVPMSVQTTPSPYQWSRPQMVMSQQPSYPPSYYTTSIYNAPPSTPSMAQPPHTQQQQTLMPQVGANLNQGTNSGLILAASGAAAAANQGNQMVKTAKLRLKAIKIIHPLTFEEIKTDDQDTNTDHSSSSLQQEGREGRENSGSVVTGGGARAVEEFALKVALVAADDSPPRHEEVVEPQSTVGAPPPPQPIINGPSEVETGKRTGTPVVSALSNSTPFEYTQKRSSSRTIVEGRGSGSPGRSSKTTSLPQTNLVKSSPIMQAQSQSPAATASPAPPPNQLPILQQGQQPISVSSPQQTSPLSTPLLMMPPMVKPQTVVPPPLLQSTLPEEQPPTPPPQQIQQSEHHPPPKQQRKPREEKKSSPVIVQVEEKRQPTPPPSSEELAPPPQVVPPSTTPPPPTPLLPTPVSAVPPPSLPQLSSFASTFQITSIKETAKAAHSAVAASIPTVEKQQPPQPTTDTPQEQPTVKASQRNKNKKNQKSREINQKGLEKEGTDMDSMVDATKTEDVTQNREPSPVGKQTAVETADALPIEVLPVSVTPPLTESSKHQEEDDEKEANDIVTAKNEENTLLSMQNSSDEVIESQVIVPSSSPPLKFDYKEDQWSPKNPTGKKVYDRDFLLKLREEPLSSKKPDSIQFDLEIFLKDKDVTVNNNNNNNNNSIRNNRYSSFSMTGSRGGNGFVPDFIRNSSSQTRSVSKRSSQQSRPGGVSSGRGSKGMYNSLSLRDDFKLNQVENAWKPVKLAKHIDVKSKEETETEELYKKVRGILNKLTPQKFDVLVGQFRRLPINNHERLTGVIRLVFEKAVDEPAFSVAYAELCKVLAKIEVKTESDDQANINFRKLLITRCQTEFEANKKAEMDFEKKQQEINETKDPDKRKELQLIFNEEERKIRMKSVGLVRFIGELYKLKMLTANIMHGCIRQLLEKIDEESLECLCKLLTTIGKELESTSLQNDRGSEWNEYFNRMSKLSRKSDQGNKISSRVRFMLQDVIELRGNKWVPRRDENKPKTMAQIQEEVEKESEKAALMANAPRNYKDDRRSEPRRNNQRGNNQSEDGWTNVVSNKNNFRSNYPPEVSKIQTLKTTAAMDMGNSNLTSLGSSTSFCHWMRGASSKQNSSFTDSNSFAVLNPEERKPPNARSLKPSASIERERALAGVKEIFPGDRSNERSRDNNRGGRSVSQHSPSPSLSAPIPSLQVQTQQPKKPEPSKTDPVAKPPPSPPAPLDQEKISLRTDELMNEFLFNSNIKESVESVKELVDGSGSQVFINCAINKILEMRTTENRIKTSELFGELLKNQVISVDAFSQEMKEVFDCAEDLQIDMPHVWQYIGEIYGPIIAKEVLGFDHLKDVSRTVSEDNKFLESTLNEIFKFLLIDKGPVWIKEQWDSSKVQLSNFLVKSNTGAFLEKYPFLEGNKVNVDDSNIPYEKVEEKLISFLKHNKDNSVDHVFDWLTINVGKRTNDPSFIGALTKAVIRASLDSNKLDKDLLHRNMILMKRYVDNNEELELGCLYTVQNLVVKTLESPSGMLVDIFKELNESSVISNEGFQKWRNPDREEMAWESDGKGVALVTLKSFFAALDDDAADELDDDAS